MKIRYKYHHEENSGGYSFEGVSYTSVSSERWLERNSSIAAAISDGGNLACSKKHSEQKSKHLESGAEGAESIGREA